MHGQALKGHLDLLLLATLEHEPAHGYAVIDALSFRTDGELDLPEGTVYPALHRLESAGLLSSSWSDSAPRRRRVYRLTRKGRAALRRERQTWQAFSRAITAVVGPGPA
jgi:PadR family transcriptional regulator PadR